MARGSQPYMPPQSPPAFLSHSAGRELKLTMASAVLSIPAYKGKLLEGKRLHGGGERPRWALESAGPRVHFWLCDLQAVPPHAVTSLLRPLF